MLKCSPQTFAIMTITLEDHNTCMYVLCISLHINFALKGKKKCSYQYLLRMQYEGLPAAAQRWAGGSWPGVTHPSPFLFRST